jgi:hypothetical protein
MEFRSELRLLDSPTLRCGTCQQEGRPLHPPTSAGSREAWRGCPDFWASSGSSLFRYLSPSTVRLFESIVCSVVITIAARLHFYLPLSRGIHQAIDAPRSVRKRPPSRAPCWSCSPPVFLNETRAADWFPSLRGDRRHTDFRAQDFARWREWRYWQAGACA